MFSRVRSDGSLVLKKTILKRYLTWEKQPTHTAFTILLNTQRSSLSLKHTHTLHKNSWRFNRQQVTGYRWEVHNLFNPVHPLNLQHTALVLILELLHSESHTHMQAHLLVPQRNCDKPFLHRRLFISDGGLPVSLALPLGFLGASESPCSVGVFDNLSKCFYSLCAANKMFRWQQSHVGLTCQLCEGLFFTP